MSRKYHVSIFDTRADGSSVGLAVWERFGTSDEDVLATTKAAAEREFPAANIEVFINSVEDRTAAATEVIRNRLVCAGCLPSGVAESGNLEAAFTFVVAIDGHDYHVEVSAQVVD